MTLADYAEAWAQEQGYHIPNRDTEEWIILYEKWVTWAFADFVP